MKYYKLRREVNPRIIGSNGESQIERISHGEILSINQSLVSPILKDFEEINKTIFEIRYHARLTDVITGLMFPFNLLFVNNRFLDILSKLKVQKFYCSRAKLVYRQKMIDDYSMFHPYLNNENFIDFKHSKFVLRNFNGENQELKSPLENYNDYRREVDLALKSTSSIRPVSIEINTEWDFDYGCCRTLGLGHIVSERFKDSLENQKILGLRYKPIKLDPFKA